MTGLSPLSGCSRLWALSCRCSPSKQSAHRITREGVYNASSAVVIAGQETWPSTVLGMLATHHEEAGEARLRLARAKSQCEYGCGVEPYLALRGLNEGAQPSAAGEADAASKSVAMADVAGRCLLGAGQQDRMKRKSSSNTWPQRGSSTTWAYGQLLPASIRCRQRGPSLLGGHMTGIRVSRPSRVHGNRRAANARGQS